MVIVAILVGGGFFGIFKVLFVGVPACAVICTVMRNCIQNRLTQVYTNDIKVIRILIISGCRNVETGGTICRETGK